MTWRSQRRPPIHRQSLLAPPYLTQHLFWEGCCGAPRYAVRASANARLNSGFRETFLSPIDIPLSLSMIGLPPMSTLEASNALASGPSSSLTSFCRGVSLTRWDSRIMGSWPGCESRFSGHSSPASICLSLCSDFDLYNSVLFFGFTNLFNGVDF